MFHTTATGSIVRCYHLPTRCESAPVAEHFMTVREARRSLADEALDFSVDRVCLPAGWGKFILEEPAPAEFDLSPMDENDWAFQPF